MPIFDFVCEKCNKTQERLVSRADVDTQMCDCQEGARMVKSDQISNTNFALKGSWYKTQRRY